MEIGSRVVVSDPGLKTHGRQGVVIANIQYSQDANIWTVRLDHGVSINISESKLSDVGGLAYVHYHDRLENPSDIHEAVGLFGEVGMTPDLVVYGPREEIIKRIMEDGEIHSYRNAFVIVRDRVYPVVHHVEVDWS